MLTRLAGIGAVTRAIWTAECSRVLGLQTFRIEWERASEPMVFERSICHALDGLGRLGEQFIPPAIVFDLREQHGTDCLLLLFRQLLRNRVGFIEKIAHCAILPSFPSTDKGVCA